MTHPLGGCTEALLQNLHHSNTESSLLLPNVCFPSAPRHAGPMPPTSILGGAGAPNFIKNGVGTQLCKHIRKSWSQSSPREATYLQHIPNLSPQIDICLSFSFEKMCSHVCNHSQAKSLLLKAQGLPKSSKHCLQNVFKHMNANKCHKEWSK